MVQALSDNESSGEREESISMEDSTATIVTTFTGAKSLERLAKAAVKASKRLNLPDDLLDDLQVLIEEEKGTPRKKLLGFRWYGGKFSHLDWLLPLLPRTTHFCELYGGSAAVLLNREPSLLETFNDVDGNLVNFFKVLRDKPEELIEKIYYTPFSREEFRNAYVLKERTDLSDIERARLFFVSAEQVRIGLAQTATPGRWAWCKLTSRRGMAGAVSRWLNRIEALWAVAERLKAVQIENLDALEVIEKYESPDTLFYCDPPYPHESRGDSHAYGFEMTEGQHRKLAVALKKTSAKVALSSYKSPLMGKLYGGWVRIDAPEMIAHSVKQARQESLWVNYNVNSIGSSAIEKSKKNGVMFNTKTANSMDEFV